MKTIRTMLLAVVAGGLLSAAVPMTAAVAREEVTFSFSTGNVRSAYSDGYWDNDHRWHRWRNRHEHHAFRDQYGDRYVADRHTRYRNGGWRDSDGDGVPDRIDRRPGNPYRS